MASWYDSLAVNGTVERLEDGLDHLPRYPAAWTISWRLILLWSSRWKPSIGSTHHASLGEAVMSRRRSPARFAACWTTLEPDRARADELRRVIEGWRSLRVLTPEPGVPGQATIWAGWAILCGRLGSRRPRRPDRRHLAVAS